VVVFKYPNDVSQRYIKRIIGLPGETVETKDGRVDIFNKDGEKVLKEENYIPQGVLTLGDVKITLKENEYFVLGDNRVASSDSRRWGPVPREDMIGRVFFRVWPLDTFTTFAAPIYE